MRGFLQRHPPLAATAFLAGVAFLAGAAGASPRTQSPVQPTGSGPPEETAMAVPRLALGGGGRDDAVALPHPLDAGVAARLRRIFALQRGGDMPAAIAETGRLGDTTLLGDILAERYLAADLPGPARPSAAQLRGWLRDFSDLPDAPAIYRLLAGTSPRGTHLPLPPDSLTLGGESPAAPLPEEADPADRAFVRNPLLDRTVQERLAPGGAGAGSALHLVTATRHLDPLYAAQLRAEIALRLFTDGDTGQALAIGRAAFSGSRGRIGLAGYVAGLAAWRGGRPREALPLFEAASRAGLTPASVRAGAAFWAARAHAQVGDAAAYRPWLERAAAAPRTFYGLLATRLLRPRSGWDQRSEQPLHLASLTGRPDGFDDAAGDEAGRATLSEIDVDALAATAAGRRVFALLQIGETGRAEASLRRLWPRVQTDIALCRSIRLVADAAGLATLSDQLAGILQSRGGLPRDEARFPVPRLSPRHGFTVDPALVYALTRLESNFDPEAVSGAGARGLMQLLPATAGFVLGQPARFAGDAVALHDPGLNLQLGQLYLAALAGRPGIDGDLVRLLAAYNAGPTAVAGWGAGEHDPLLFIESLPTDETRDYVRRALTYLWIYADRLHLPSPSLDALAAGRWPRFVDEAGLRGRPLH